MTENMEEYKGIRCPNPNCRALNKVSVGQNRKTTDCITRPKTCKVCGTTFETVEVPTKIIEIKNNHTNTVEGTDITQGAPPATQGTSGPAEQPVPEIASGIPEQATVVGHVDGINVHTWKHTDDTFMAVFDGFITLQESISGHGSTGDKAVKNLLEEKEKAVSK